MIHFAHPEYLKWLAGILFGTGLLIWYMQWRKTAMHKLAQPHLLHKIFKGHSGNTLIISGMLFLLAAAITIVGLANPQIGARPEKARQMGMDIVIALDISKSMDAQDLKPSRLERAKQFAGRLISTLGADQVGLVVFAGNAYQQMPLSSDHAAAKMFLSAATTDMAPTQGTAIGRALQISYDLLMPRDKHQLRTSSKVILLFSDGENHDEDAFDIAEEIGDNGVRIFTIGTGKEEGAPIPTSIYGVPDLLKDESGETVISKLDQSMLEKLADAGHGRFYRLISDNDVMTGLHNRLNRLNRAERDVKIYTAYNSQFQWFIGAGLLLLVAEWALRKKKEARP